MKITNRDRVQKHPWKKQIEKNTQDFIENFGALTEEELNWKPDPKTWSIAQNISHLIQFNKSYFPIFGSLQEGVYKAPFMARFKFIISFFGKIILKSAQPQSERKVKTISIWEPVKSSIAEGIIDEFKQHQSELIGAMEKATDLAKKGTVIPSPANRFIVYPIDVAFDIIVAHEKRHLKQSKKVYQIIVGLNEK
ncbi:MAG: DinB family protein [Flavobacteriaceae bacterium]